MIVSKSVVKLINSSKNKLKVEISGKIQLIPKSHSLLGRFSKHLE